jgi:hypothetical protein
LYESKKGDKLEVLPAHVTKHIAEVKLQLYSFVIFTVDGGENPSSCAGRFTPGKKPPFPEYLAGWVTETIWTFGRRHKAFSGRELRIVQPVAKSLYRLQLR